MGFLMSLNDTIEKISDFLEGDALPVYLSNFSWFMSQLESLTKKYSDLIPLSDYSEPVPCYCATCFEFPYIVTTVVCPKDSENLTLFKMGLRRAVTVALNQLYPNNRNFISVYVVSDPHSRNENFVYAYFSVTRRQQRKLLAWYQRMMEMEKEQYFVGNGLKDAELEKEFRELKG